MMNIEKINMRLPGGFEHRASNIAQLVGEEMSNRQLSGNHALERISLGVIQISLNATDAEVAHSVVDRVMEALGEYYG